MPETAEPAPEALPVRCEGTLLLDPLQPQGDLRPVPLRPGKYTFGSSPECTVTLPAAGVQPVHCLILVNRLRAVLKAWDRRTWLNEGPIPEAQLHPGDRLAIGPLEFRVRIASREELDEFGRLRRPGGSTGCAEGPTDRDDGPPGRRAVPEPRSPQPVSNFPGDSHSSTRPDREQEKLARQARLLSERQRDLDAGWRQLEARREELARQQDETDRTWRKRRADLEARERERDEAERNRLRAIERRERTVSAREERLARRDTDARADRIALENEWQQLHERQNAWAEQSSWIEQKTRDLESAERRIETEKRRLQEERAEVARRHESPDGSDAAAQRQCGRAQRDEFRAEQDERNAARDRENAQREELNRRKAELSAGQRQLDRERQQLQVDREALSQELDALADQRDRIDRQREELARQERRLHRQQEDLQTRQSELVAERRRWREAEGRSDDSLAGRSTDCSAVPADRADEGPGSSDDLRIALQQIFGRTVSGGSTAEHDPTPGSTRLAAGARPDAERDEQQPVHSAESGIESSLDLLFEMNSAAETGCTGQSAVAESPGDPRPVQDAPQSPSETPAAPTAGKRPAEMTAPQEIVLEDAMNPDSVAAYMERLLARTGERAGGVGGAASGSPHPDSTAGTARPAETSSAADPPAGNAPRPASVDPPTSAEPVPSGRRDGPDKETVRAELDSLRDVANQTAHSAIARYVARKLWRRIGIQAALTAAASALSLLAWLGGPAVPGETEILRWPAAFIAALAGGELLRTILSMARIRRGATTRARDPGDVPDPILQR